MTLWAVEIAYIDARGVQRSEILLLAATGPYEADTKAIDRCMTAGYAAWFLTGHRWMVAPEEYTS